MITNLKLNRDSRKADDLVICHLSNLPVQEKCVVGSSRLKALIVFLLSYAVSVIIHFHTHFVYKASL
jgi:hypothetical protein